MMDNIKYKLEITEVVNSLFKYSLCKFNKHKNILPTNYKCNKITENILLVYTINKTLRIINGNIILCNFKIINDNILEAIIYSQIKNGLIKVIIYSSHRKSNYFIKDLVNLHNRAISRYRLNVPYEIKKKYYRNIKRVKYEK